MKLSKRALWLDAIGISRWRYEPAWLQRFAQKSLPSAPAPQGRTIRCESQQIEENPHLSASEALPLSAPTQAARLASSELASLSAALAHSSWEELEQAIRSCSACPLAKERTQAVPGAGDRDHPQWLFVGEGPGKEEDRQGLPFVGAAGKLLDEMLFALGLSRSKGLFITNAVKCRPPQNRTPNLDEIAACNPYLCRQIELLAPQIIVALGRPAAQAVLNRELKISEARQRVFDYAGIPVVVTFHPAYLLRNPLEKEKAWRDLLFAQRLLANRVGALR